MPTIAQSITQYLKEKRGQWICGGDLERYATSLHKPSAVGRELRRLTTDGVVEMTTGTATVDNAAEVINTGGMKFVWYRLTPEL